MFVGGREVLDADWPRPKARLLVKLLALQPEYHLHTEQLIEALYPRREHDKARRNLHRLVHSARRALEPGLAEGEPSRFIHRRKGRGYSLEAPGGVSTDLEEFERLAAEAFRVRTRAACERALALYGGDVLAEVLYHDWARARRERTAALYVGLLRLAAQVFESEGMRAEAAECYRRLTEREPTDEEGHRQLMRLYALAGDRSQARRQYELCAAALERELGEKPEPATENLYGQIASGEFRGGAPAGRAQAAARPKLRKLTSQLGTVLEARCTADESLFACSAMWEGRPAEVYTMHGESGGWSPREGLHGAVLFALSRSGELAVGLRRRFVRGFVAAGSLARVAATGEGAPRELPPGDVQWADFAPDGRGLVVARDVEGRNRLEYAGRVLYETGGWVSHPRFSPGGEWVAFIDHPVRGDDRGEVKLVPAAGGEARRLAGPWLSAQGLAWAASGAEVWFTAEAGSSRAVYAAALDGATRFIYAGAGSLTLHDVTAAGRLLLSRDDTRLEIIGRLPGAGRESKLSQKFHWALARDLSDDGRLLLLTESGEGGGGPYGVYLVATDGSSSARLGDGSALALSPGGEWALAVRREPEHRLMLLPTSGRGAPKLFDPAGLVYEPWGCWFPDGRRVLFAAGKEGRGTGLYAQDLEGGRPVCLTPDEDGVELTTTHAVSPDGRRVAAVRHDGTVWLYDADGGGGRVPVAGLEPGEVPVRWCGASGLYVFRRGDVPTRVFRVSLEGGAREPLLELSPPDPTGVHEVLRVLMTPDASAYVYTCTRSLSDLYLLEGLA